MAFGPVTEVPGVEGRELYHAMSRILELADANERTIAIAERFADCGLSVPQLAIVNPPLWELGHVAWFTEYWILRNLAQKPATLARADTLYDSAKVAHATRWMLPLPSFEATVRYAHDVRERVAEFLDRTHDDSSRYFGALALFHEDMHGEAGLMTAQTLRRPWPLVVHAKPDERGSFTGDVEIPGGRYRIGAELGEQRFVFDNEKWAHDVDVDSFRIARAPTTNAQYVEFVQAGGAPPRDWVRGDDGRWLRHRFDEIVSLRSNAPVCNVSRVEAERYCRWAGRRLPTEAEWEIAATYDLHTGEKRRYPWGDDPPGVERANLDARMREPADVAAFPDGDTPHGIRQMIGNVWEWTSSAFAPYPAFVCDPYKEYSAPWFNDHAVLRGGSWVTRGRLIHGAWRNFYRPDRSDPFAGFRTCALR
ncbi:MAG: selenoneine synthase SenA [Vulcanimicrobiaceae bacterium]